ncbi:hypothetical protein KC19_11G076700 [Ceratodon purpureus]|uniref:Uncharacterized protein n=1 Tax=Ceratodon purpureus TaxID=3225 RepID=A0A8T0GCL2_CERPU|nr:hypothetical protein KC19_11G076700 [Ceratodon purpureus]
MITNCSRRITTCNHCTLHEMEAVKCMRSEAAPKLRPMISPTSQLLEIQLPISKTQTKIPNPSGNSSIADPFGARGRTETPCNGRSGIALHRKKASQEECRALQYPSKHGPFFKPGRKWTSVHTRARKASSQSCREALSRRQSRGGRGIE